MADRRKLAQGLMMMTPAMREDLAGREQDIQRGKTVELLRRAGKEMYENPIVNAAIGFTPGVGDVQAAGETFAALQRGTPWQETAGYAVGMLPFVPALRTTWHGSPHGFTKFDMSKIGTGEGAQAYGHGLYLADAPETATSYAKPAIQDIRMTSEGKMFDLNTGETIGPIQGFPKHEDLLKDKQGYLYKVELPDEQIAKMLDWDRPLSEQAPKVKQAIAPFVEDIVKNSLHGEDYLLNGQWTRTRDIPANNLWGNLANKYGPEKASQTLYEAGIPGIQYLDQASRGAGEGTRNYVVFSDEIPQILERNGQPVAQDLREYKQLESLNPTGTVMTEYNPLERATLPLGKNMTTLDVTAGMSPDEMVEIYRGVPQGVSQISPGDFITTNRQLAQDYAGNGNVISQKVPYRTILDDLNEPLGEEYIYRP